MKVRAQALTPFPQIGETEMEVITVNYDSFLGPILYRFPSHDVALDSFKTTYAKMGVITERRTVGTFPTSVYLVRKADSEMVCVGAIYPLDHLPTFEKVIHF